jgi:hypothetical protein
MTLNDETIYRILRDGIAGGLTNVGHRFNYAGITKIDKLPIEKRNHQTYVYSKDTNNIMTHITGCDFSSLYPSVFSSNIHPFIPYMGHKMYMPGYQTNRYTKEDQGQEFLNALIDNPHRLECDNQDIIDSIPWTVSVLIGHIDENFLNDFINFPPIIKKLELTTTETNIGHYMHQHMKNNNLSLDKTEKKLTQLLTTHERAMSFGMCEIWFLIDKCHFLIDEVQTVITFTKHDKFNKFVNHFFDERKVAKKAGNEGKSILCKIILNGSYGADGQNNEKFSKINFCNEEKATKMQAAGDFKHTTKVNDNLFIIEREPLAATCKKPLQSAFATLSNAKFWYLTIIY